MSPVRTAGQLDDGTFGVRQEPGGDFKAWAWRTPMGSDAQEIWVMSTDFVRPASDAGGPVTLEMEYITDEPDAYAGDPHPELGEPDIVRFLAWIGEGDIGSTSGYTVARHSIADETPPWGTL